MNKLGYMLEPPRIRRYEPKGRDNAIGADNQQERLAKMRESSETNTPSILNRVKIESELSGDRQSRSGDAPAPRFRRGVTKSRNAGTAGLTRATTGSV
jgi:hypothetical protein